MAWHPLGWKPVFFSDIDLFLQAVLSHHYPDVPWRGKPTNPDGRRYKALGNSMTVNVMEWLGGRIAMVDQLP